MASRREEPADLVEGQPPADPVGVAKEVLLRLLTPKARTRAELAEALAKRHVPADAAAEALDRFAELGLIDDAAYAGQWVEGQQRRMRSRRVLRQELQRKGVDHEVIDEAMDAVGEVDDEEAALAFARRKLRGMQGLDEAVRQRRLLGALSRRGFGPATCYRAYKAVAAEVDPATGAEPR